MLLLHDPPSTASVFPPPPQPQNLAQNSLAGKERHPGKAQVVRVHEHVLDKKVRTAAVLEYRGDKNENTQITKLHLEPDFTPKAYPLAHRTHKYTPPNTWGTFSLSNEAGVHVFEAD